MIKLILSAIVVVGGIVAWILKNYLGLSARIETAEKERDILDEKIKLSIHSGNSSMVVKLNNDRLLLSRKLNHLYARQRKNLFHRT